MTHKEKLEEFLLLSAQTSTKPLAIVILLATYILNNNVKASINIEENNNITLIF